MFYASAMRTLGNAIELERRRQTDRGGDVLAARPVPGRPAKRTRAREKVVARWLDEPPTAFGFATGLWTAGRAAAAITDPFHPNDVSH